MSQFNFVFDDFETFHEGTNEPLKELVHFENFVMTSGLDCSVENDGIGEFEFWGMRGFDEGHNSLVVDSQEVSEVKILITKNLDSVSIKDLKESVTDFLCCNIKDRNITLSCGCDDAPRKHKCNCVDGIVSFKLRDWKFEFDNEIILISVTGYWE